MFAATLKGCGQKSPHSSREVEGPARRSLGNLWQGLQSNNQPMPRRCQLRQMARNLAGRLEDEG